MDDAASDAGRNWSEDLEALHEESSRTHFIDIRTRAAMIQSLGVLKEQPVLLDLGCSSGYLLEDLRQRYPAARLLGYDIVGAGLQRAAQGPSGAALAQVDARQLPISSGGLDAVVSANLLEHVLEDHLALAEVARVLKPGGRFVAVVPAAPATFDYYDRYLRHERRYARGELRRKAIVAGFDVVDEQLIGTLIFPAFWLVKKYHRARFDHLVGDALRARVEHDVQSTKDSAIGHALMRAETWLQRRGVIIPFGIRQLVAMERAR